MLCPATLLTAFLQPDKFQKDSELIIDGVSYPLLDSAEIPAGYAQADVTLQREIGGVEYPTSLVGGMVGTKICSSGDKALSDAAEEEESYLVHSFDDDEDNEAPAGGCDFDADTVSEG